MKSPKISVIVPSHNSVKTIGSCLKRILNQNCSLEFEVIVVDDASTDSTKEVAKGFPVKVIELVENLGAGGARNRGAEQASGEILFFVDSDVYLEPDALSSLVKFFEANPDLSAVVGSYSVFSFFGDPFSIYHNFFTFYHHNLSPGEVEWFWGAIGAVKKDVFRKLGGFREDYPGASAEDIEFGYRLKEAGQRIGYSREIVGEHARRFDFRSMLYNDFRKALLGVKLYLSRKRMGVGRHGFSRLSNGLSILAIYLFWLSIFNFIFRGDFGLSAFSVLSFMALNISFYQFIFRKAGFEGFINALFLHFIQFNAIAFGALMGLIGLAMGKGLESRSKWI